MRFSPALAVVALCVLAVCVGSGAASELRGEVRASVGSNNCNCNFQIASIVWPSISCGCSGACSGTCCYFSYPGQYPTLQSFCTCTGMAKTFWNTANLAGYSDVEANCIPLPHNPSVSHASYPGDNYYLGGDDWTQETPTDWF